ncbi:hypothetical protein HDU76_007254, partial [Blyttiomyces sp. JEL0837]
MAAPRTLTNLVMFFLFAITTIANLSHAAVNKRALVLSKASEDTIVTNVLIANSIPYDVVYVDSTGLTAPLTLTSGSVGQYALIVMTSKFVFNYNGLWYPSLNGTALTNIYTYLATYGARLVQLGDNPDPALGVTAVGTGADNGQNIIYADATLATNANHAPTLALSTAGTSTCGTLGTLWLSWGLQISFAPFSGPFNYNQKVLVLSKPDEGNSSTIILQAYGIPFDLLIVPATGVTTFALENAPTFGLYSLIVMTSPLT